MKEYWNENYWKYYFEKSKNKKLDFTNNMWVDKYKNIIDKINGKKVLDLGCGLGQYTKYFLDKGFDVISCDISKVVLEQLEKNIPNSKTLELDMSNKFPFEDKEFDIVFANLSIHYFDENTTKKLLCEIKRILKSDGYFIGSVNSVKTLKYKYGTRIEIEPNYYLEKNNDYERYVRLFDKEQFENFFTDFKFEVLEEVTTSRGEKTKIMWEFIAKII